MKKAKDNTMSLLDIKQIMTLLPHRFPFLMVDSVEEYSRGEILCKKNITVTEPYFQGHFPQNPIVPGVLLVESGAQAAALMYILDEIDTDNIENSDKKKIVYSEELAQKVGYLASIKNFKFKGLALPGEVIYIKCQKKIALGKLFEVDVKISNKNNRVIGFGKVLVSQK